MDEIEVLLLALEHEGVVGWGQAQASPAVTGEDQATVQAQLEALEPAGLDVDDLEATLAAHDHLGPGARAGLDLALHDLAGKLTGQPAHTMRAWPEGWTGCAATITLTDPTAAGEQAADWFHRGFTRLKVKVGEAKGALPLVDAVREVLPERLPDRFPAPQLWIDANEGFDLEGALSLLPALAERGVELVEQPLPRDQLDGYAELAKATDLPIVLDEGIRSPADIAALEGLPANLAVNLKVQKVGGLVAAGRCLQAARDQDRKVLVGCNVETGLGIAAGACLVGAVDWVDLDGNLFLEHDPFPLPRPGPGRIGTLDGPGLGVLPDERYLQR